MQPDQQTLQQANLIEVVRQFQSWREGRQRGARIPPALWQPATSLAGVHGISRVSTALRIDYYALKKRLDALQPEAQLTAGAPIHAPLFVEMPRPTAQSTITCTIEVERLDGDSVRSKLRVELQEVGLADFDSLLQSMWGRRA